MSLARFGWEALMVSYDKSDRECAAAVIDAYNAGLRDGLEGDEGDRIGFGAQETAAYDIGFEDGLAECQGSA